MNVDSLSVETEILQSRLAVQLLKERHIVASRRMKKRIDKGDEVKLSTTSLNMTNEANFFHSLQSWSRNLGILATEVQSLSNYASRKSEHFEGYDVAMRCLQRIIIHDYALASLLSSSSNQPVTTTSLSALLEACSTLVTSEEVQETTRLLLQRTLAYASLFSLSKCQFATCAELSRALLVLSYDSHTNSTSSDVSNVWIMRSLAWGGMGHAPLALVHYKNAASSSSSGSNSESTPATSSTPFPASQLAITKYLEQQELAHAHIYTHSSTPSLVLHELDRILRSMGAGDASMCSVLTESPDLEEVHVKEYQSVLSHTPSHTPLSSHTPSQTPSLSDGILDMITKAVCAGDDKKGSGGRDGGGSRSIYTLYGKVIANTLLSKIKSRGQMKGENGGSSDVDSVSSVICMLGQVIYHLLVTSFYEAQTLFQEHLYLSAQIRYTLCRACVGILKSESVYVKAITKVVCGVPCSNEGINMHYDKVAEEIKAYIDSIDRASMCNLWMCGDKLGSSNNSKVVVDELIGPVEQVRSLAHCVKANRHEEAQGIIKELETSVLPSFTSPSDFVCDYIPRPYPSFISPLFAQVYITGSCLPGVRIDPEKLVCVDNISSKKEGSDGRVGNQEASILGYMQALSAVDDKYALCKLLSYTHSDDKECALVRSSGFQFLPSTSRSIPYSDYLRYVLYMKDGCKK